MLENGDKASESPWQLEDKVGARQAVLTGMEALCEEGGWGASNNTLDPWWGSV